MAVPVTTVEVEIIRKVVIAANTLVSALYPDLQIINEGWFGAGGVDANDNAADILSRFGVTKQQLADVAYVLKDLGEEEPGSNVPPSLGRFINQKITTLARVAAVRV